MGSRRGGFDRSIKATCTYDCRSVGSTAAPITTFRAVAGIASGRSAYPDRSFDCSACSLPICDCSSLVTSMVITALTFCGSRDAKLLDWAGDVPVAIRTQSDAMTAGMNDAEVTFRMNVPVETLVETTAIEIDNRSDTCWCAVNARERTPLHVPTPAVRWPGR